MSQTYILDIYAEDLRMIQWYDAEGFHWDRGNIEKNWEKTRLPISNVKKCFSINR